MRGVAAAILLAGLSVVQSRTLKYTLNITDAIVSPDGFSRSAVTINGQTPGPVLTGNKGDDFLVLVNNYLNDTSMRQSLTIHWHGILQHAVAYDDGPAQVTQCPIAPGRSYQYFVKTTSPKDGEQTGTYWYHSHLSTQYIDGLRGAIVLYDPDDPHKELYDVDDRNTIITLTDWYHESAEKLGKDWIGNKIPEPIPDSNLLNGLGRYGNNSNAPRAVINVVQGKRYRFRIINMSAIVPFNFTVENHDMTIIEADGVLHKPYVVSSVGISAGQRYSVVINANQPVRNYWIAYPSNFRIVTVPEINPNYNGTEAFAILRYQGAPDADPTTAQHKPPQTGVFQEYKLKPLVSPPPPGPSDNVMAPLNLTFEPTVNGSIDAPGSANVWVINGVQYTPPKVPTLLQILSDAAAGNQTAQLPPDVMVLPRNTVVTARLIGDEHHPFHLHGHTFQVIQSAFGPLNEIDPPIRDTVDTNNAGGVNAVTIRFRTDNPGPWFLHCHKDWHLEAGLALVFAEDRFGIPSSVKPPQAWKDLCNIYNALPKEQQ